MASRLFATALALSLIAVTPRLASACPQTQPTSQRAQAAKRIIVLRRDARGAVTRETFTVVGIRQPPRATSPRRASPDVQPSSKSVDHVDLNWPGPWQTMEARVVELVNQRRALGATCGTQVFAPVGPLRAETRLILAARAHSRDMAHRRFFSHFNLEGQSSFDRIEAMGYRSRASGENISAGRSTPEAVVEGWMSSPGHCANIMSPNFTEIGVGYFPASDQFGHYWTQNFGRPASS